MRFGQENAIAEVTVLLAIKTLKSGKTAGPDEIRNEMLKALSRALCLKRVCHVPWCSGKAWKVWGTLVSSLYTKM